MLLEFRTSFLLIMFMNLLTTDKDINKLLRRLAAHGSEDLPVCSFKYMPAQVVTDLVTRKVYYSLTLGLCVITCH